MGRGSRSSAADRTTGPGREDCRDPTRLSPASGWSRSRIVRTDLRDVSGRVCSAARRGSRDRHRLLLEGRERRASCRQSESSTTTRRPPPVTSLGDQLRDDGPGIGGIGRGPDHDRRVLARAPHELLDLPAEAASLGPLVADPDEDPIDAVIGGVTLHLDEPSVRLGLEGHARLPPRSSIALIARARIPASSVSSTGTTVENAERKSFQACSTSMIVRSSSTFATALSPPSLGRVGGHLPFLDAALVIEPGIRAGRPGPASPTSLDTSVVGERERRARRPVGNAACLEEEPEPAADQSDDLVAITRGLQARPAAGRSRSGP